MDGRYKQPTIWVSIQCAATTIFRGPFGIIQLKWSNYEAKTAKRPKLCYPKVYLINSVTYGS